MKVLRFLFLVLLFSGCSSQEKLLSRANNHFNDLAYADAIPLYERLLQRSNDEEAIRNLAKAYQLNQNYQKASYWLSYLYSNNPSNATYSLMYANGLLLNGETERAQKQFEITPVNPEIKEELLKGLASTALIIKAEKTPASFQIKPASFNSVYADYSPVQLDDELVFTSTRPFKNKKRLIDPWYNQPYASLFVVKNPSSEESRARVFKKITDFDFHQGPIGLDPSNKKLVVSENQGSFYEGRANYNKLSLVLYTRAYGETVFKRKGKLTFNNENFNFSHPAFNRTGTQLYFSSDMPGGYGATDVWYVNILEDGTYSKSINAGPTVNTKGNDCFPSFGLKNELYFASDGRPGFGGLDIFLAPNLDSITHSPINLGKGLNGFSDDFGISFSTDSSGFFSSNRKNGQGLDDIYMFKKLKVTEELELLASKEKPVDTDSAKVSDKNDDVAGDELSENAPADSTQGTQNQELDTSSTVNSTISDSILVLNPDSTVNAPNRVPEPDTLVRTTDTNKTLGIGSKLKELIVSVSQPNNDKVNQRQGDSIQVSGLIIEEKSKLPTKTGVVVFMDTVNGTQKIVITDRTGFFTTWLADSTRYMVLSQPLGYAVDTIYLNTTDLTSPAELKPFVAKGGERIYDLTFRNIYFDFDRATLRPESKDELEVMYNILRRSSKLRVEVSAHTDSRGPDSYNLILSDQRALSVYKYLISRGISADRIISKGYGETKLQNNCSDGVACSKEAHQLNRRVEFTVIDEKNKVIQRSED